MRKKIKICLGLIILVICFFFLVKALFINWHQVDSQELTFNWLFLLISYVIWFLAFLLMGFLWKATIMYVGERLSFIQALRIISLSMLPKYMPGKVFGIVGQVWLTKKEGNVSGEKGGVCAILEIVISVLSGTLLSVIILPFVLKNKFSPNFYLMLVIIPVLFIILYPPLFMKIVNWGLRKLKREEIEFIPRYTQLLKLFVLNIIFWIAQCVAVYFLIRSFYSPISPSFFIPLCGIFPGAWVIGFLSFITPGGLGVREGALAYFFSFYMPTSIGIIVSIIIRIWATIGELAFFAVFARNIKKYI